MVTIYQAQGRTKLIAGWGPVGAQGMGSQAGRGGQEETSELSLDGGHSPEGGEVGRWGHGDASGRWKDLLEKEGACAEAE